MPVPIAVALYFFGQDFRPSRSEVIVEEVLISNFGYFLRGPWSIRKLTTLTVSIGPRPFRHGYRNCRNKVSDFIEVSINYVGGVLQIFLLVVWHLTG
jgi:hypothetical protein